MRNLDKKLLHFIKTTALITLTVPGLLGILIYSFNYLENPRSSFATYQDMEGLIEHGWLPSYFPRSATDIQESHNIDTNQVQASFKYNTRDFSTIRGACKVIAESEAGTKFLCPPFDSRTSTMVLKTDSTAYYLSYENGL